MAIKLFGFYYKYFSEVSVKRAMLREIEKNNLPIEVLYLFFEAWDSRFWVVYGFDGKTLIKDKYAGRVSNFIHDYLSRTGRGGLLADTIFKWTEVKTGSNRFFTNYIQYPAVRLAHISIIQFRDMIKSRNGKLSYNTKKLYLKIKKGIY